MNGSECGLSPSTAHAASRNSRSSRTPEDTEPSSRSVAIRRSLITRLVSSLTTHSIPAMAPSSSASGL